MKRLTNKTEDYRFIYPINEWIKIPFNNNAPPQRVILRVDAGKRYGLSFGHLSRCFIIAKSFEKVFSSECFFLMKDLKDGVQHALLAGVKVKILPTKKENLFIREVVANFQPDCIVVDLPYPNEDFSFFVALKNEFHIKLFIIDDNRYINPGADIFLNSNILANQKVKKCNFDKTLYFLGPQYFIFDETLIDNSCPILNNSFFNIVLSFGGADPTDLMLKVVNNLLQITHQSIKYYAILGPGYSKQTILYEIIHKACNFYIINNPKNIIPFFYSCSFVICAGGRTMYELLYLNKSFMPIASAPHEASAISELMENKLIKFGMKQWNSKMFLKNMRIVLAKIGI